MRFTFIIAIYFILTFLTAQNVVINEVLYDPDGTDTGYEWIELFNAGDQPVNLENWKIQKAGSEFIDQFTFPSIIIEPDSFLLIGEEFVPNADITTSLEFQNGGPETDGIRIVSFSGQYTDTVLYDSPNTNNLPDDDGSPGIYFAPDVSGGNSLARKHDGEDTNNCELDFFECEEPTPREPNFYPIDMAIYELEIAEIEGVYWLETQVFNLSTEIVDNSTSNLEISINDTLLGVYDLPEILPESYIDFSCELGSFIEGAHIISVTANYFYDNNLENNYLASSILIGDSPLILNEIMFKPESSNQEWIEIYNRSTCGYLVDNWTIIDASGGQIGFSGTIESQDFLVVCQNRNLLLEIYPEVNPDKIIEAESWTSLNNTEESLKLIDLYETKFDSTYYSGSSCPSDFSIERVNPFCDKNIIWEICLDSLGTPTLANSVLPIEKDMELTFLGFTLSEDHIEHSILIKNIGLEQIPSGIFTCYSSINEETTETELFQDEISISDSIDFSFSTAIPSTGYTTFRYEVYSSEDLNTSNNSDFSFYNSNALPFVINEIMYNPNEDEPEWLELKVNDFIPALEEIFLVVDEDSLLLPFSDNEYFIITGSNDDVEFLETNYNLENVPVFSGLGSLSNDGEQILLIDESGNLIESFFYLPEWNDKLKGVSIERVNPSLTANPENWGPSVSVCTPGAQNSIFVQVLPTKMKLSVEPNPFSPYRSERTIFSFKLPEIISTVTIRIFDLKGRMINKLVDQTMQASEGNIIWDGKDKNGKNLPVGVYIVLMEATSRDTEKVYSKKITVVIGK